MILQLMGWGALSIVSSLLLLHVLQIESKHLVLESRARESEIHSIAERHDFLVVKRFLDNYYLLEQKRSNERPDHDKHLIDTLANLTKNEHVRWVDRDHVKGHSKRGFVPEVPDFNDPLFPKQWYYQSEGQSGIVEGSDHSIIDVWKMGFNGSGVKIVVIDDGLDSTHLDLRDKYNATISFDFNENDTDPAPRIVENDPEFNAHGTKCAGQIAAEPDNGICGVGIAYGAQIGGNKILDGKVTDTMEARAFRHHCEEVDIYSMSWGPTDDGKTYGGFLKSSYAAVDYCIKNGRRGLGSIYVWASGNGGSSGDCCSADSLVSSPYSVAIAALTHESKPAYFQETCPGILTSVYSGGVSKLQMKNLKEGAKMEKSHPMVTTNIMLNKKSPTSLDNCDEYFSGTSAAGPLGAGMIALMLQANPFLNWRDVQHIIVETSDQPNPKGISSEDDGKWALNGDGRTVSHDLGFGVMNAAKMVMTAQNWSTVPARKQCVVATISEKKEIINMKDGETIYRMRAQCKGVKILEHVVAIISLNASHRGSVFIKLTSPSNFTSVLMRPRPLDNNTTPIDRWPYVSVLHWGEESEGDWVLSVSYDPSVFSTTNRPAQPASAERDSLKSAGQEEKETNYKGALYFVQLVLYGTAERHVNPSKSNPKLAEVGHETSFEKTAIKEQFKHDAKKNELIGQIVDNSMSKREELAENMSEKTMGGVDDFIDPYEGKLSLSGYQPRVNDNFRDGWVVKREDDWLPRAPMGTLEDFRDPNEGKLTLSGYQPRRI